MSMIQGVKEFIGELELKKKLSPWQNPNIAWFYIFFPSLIAYFMLMAQNLNAKPIIGSFDIVHLPQFHKIIPKNAELELLIDDVKWAEGPVWIEESSSGLGHLLFSDTIDNKIFKWEEGKGMFTIGKTLYLDHSGCFSGNNACNNGAKDEPGSNGILEQSITEFKNNPDDIDLLVCQHGDRAISLMRSNGTRTWVVRSYNGSRLNSPNDLIQSPDGHVYFTDPIYGLYQTDHTSNDSSEGNDGNHSNKDKKGERKINPNDVDLNFSGVYMIPAVEYAKAISTGRPASRIILLDDKLTRPNGLAFSPDYSKLYVTNSDENNKVIMVYDISEDGKGTVSNGRVFYNATAANLNGEGNLDGMTVDIHGNMLVAGPGGVLILTARGTLLGRLRLPKRATNVVFGDYGRIYITGDGMVVRTKISTRPLKAIRR